MKNCILWGFCRMKYGVLKNGPLSANRLDSCVVIRHDGWAPWNILSWQNCCTTTSIITYLKAWIKTRVKSLPEVHNDRYHAVFTGSINIALQGGILNEFIRAPARLPFDHIYIYYNSPLKADHFNILKWVHLSMHISLHPRQQNNTYTNTRLA